MEPINPSQPMYRVIGADQKQYGPIAADQVRQWIQQHRLNGQSLAWLEGTPSWKPLAQFPEFADQFPATSLAGGGTAPLSSSYPPSPGQVYPKTNALAVTSLIMGTVSVCLACCCYGFPFNVLGIVFGVIGLLQIRQNPTWETGGGFAWAGIILAVFSILLAILIYAWSSSLDPESLQQQLEKWRNL